MIAWDESKRRSNVQRHGIDFAELAAAFDFPMLTREDPCMDHGEQRLLSLAWFNGRVVFMVWIERYDSVRLISCRYGTKHETKAYFQAVENG